MSAEQAARGVVDEVRLHAVEDLEVFIFRLFQRQHDLGKGLHVAVIGDGDRLMPPADRCVHDLGGRDDRVHLRHVGVQMQLDALLLCLVNALMAADLHHALERQEGLVIKFIKHHTAKDGDVRAVFQPFEPLGFIGMTTFLCINGGRAIGNANGTGHTIAASALLGGQLKHRTKKQRVGMQTLRLR